MGKEGLTLVVSLKTGKQALPRESYAYAAELRSHPFSIRGGFVRKHIFICVKRKQVRQQVRRRATIRMDRTAILSSFDRYTTYSFDGKTFTADSVVER